MFNDAFTAMEYAYFNREPIIEHTDTTYTENAQEVSIASYSWNHSMGDVFQALLGAGLQLIDFQEYDCSPWNCFENSVNAPKGWQIKGFEGKLPMVFSILLRKH